MNIFIACVCETNCGCAGRKIHFITMVWGLWSFSKSFSFIFKLSLLFWYRTQIGRYTWSAINAIPYIPHYSRSGFVCVGFPRGIHFTGTQIVTECFTCVKRRAIWRNHLLCYSFVVCVFYVGFWVFDTHNGEVIDVGEMDIATKRGLWVYHRTGRA